MTPEQLAACVREALAQLAQRGELVVPADAIPAEITVERPKNRDHGDWATNIALVVAKAAEIGRAHV